MNKAQKCPVCNGEGKLKEGFTSTIYKTKTCHVCNGKGWVEVKGAKK